MAQLAAVQRDFMNGDASGLQQLYSHRDDVMGGFGGFERGWARSRPAARLGGHALSWRSLQSRGHQRYRRQGCRLSRLPGTLGAQRLGRPAPPNHGTERDPNLPAGGRPVAPLPPPRRRAGPKTRTRLSRYRRLARHIKRKAATRLSVIIQSTAAERGLRKEQGGRSAAGFRDSQAVEII